jgi:LysM repeat protein
MGDEVCLARYEPTQRIVRCANQYVINYGDNCNSICSRYSLSLNYFYRLNPGLDCDHLTIGDNVCIPVKPIEYSTIRITTPERTYSHRYDNCGNTYVIRSGDDCSRICDSYHLEYSSFISLNPGLNCNYLPIGQTVCISPKVALVQSYRPLRKVHDCQNIYTVIQSSDSCGTICDRYKITTESFYRLNPKIDCNDIRLGDEICVPAIHQYPAHAFTANCGASYLVRLGDTCNTICDRYKIELQDFYQLNRQVSCSRLVPGQSICLSGRLN